jgi:hypothetical protein
MNWRQDWAQERRADRVTAAEQRRLDDAAALELALREQKAQAKAKADASKARAARWSARGTALATWAAAHRVDLMIYPLAVTSAVLAVPSMAEYGTEVYGSGAGVVLPVLTELGMWAFAFALQMRRRQGATEGAWALQLGVWTFAAIAAALNFAHGQTVGTATGLVMAVVSVAGVVAHQLVTAGGRRTCAERAAARKVAAATRAAIRAAAVEIDGFGSANLVDPGLYTLSRHPLTRRPRIAEAVESPLPLDDDDPAPADPPPVDPFVATLAGLTKADAVRTAIAALGGRPDSRTAAAWLAERGVEIAPTYVSDVARRDAARDSKANTHRSTAGRVLRPVAS